MWRKGDGVGAGADGEGAERLVAGGGPLEGVSCAVRVEGNLKVPFKVSCP